MINYTANRDRKLLILSLIYIVWLYLAPAFQIIFNYHPISLHFGRALIPLFIILIFENRVFIRIILRNKNFILYLGVSLVLVMLSTLFAHESNLPDMLFDLYNILTCWVMYMIFYYLSTSNNNISIILTLMGFMGLINSLIGIYGALTGNMLFGVSYEDVGFGTMGYDIATGRSGGLRGENYVGIWNIPTLVYGFLLLKKNKIHLTIIGVILVLISSLSIIVSLSRTSAICGIVAIFLCFLFFFLRERSFYKNLFKHYILLIILFILIIIFGRFIILRQTAFFSNYVSNDQQRRWMLSEIIENDRKYIWREYINYSLSDPILGKGPGFIENQFLKGYNVPHNSELDIFVEYGIIGMFIYMLPIFIGIKLFFKTKEKKYKDQYALCLFVIFMANFIGLQFLSNPFFKLMWMVLGAFQGRLLLTNRLYKYSLHKNDNFIIR